MRSTLVLMMTLAAALPLAAQTVVTPTSPNGWAADGGHTQGGGTAAITSTYPDPNLSGDNGSLELSMPNGSAAAAYALTFSSPVSLGSFSSAGFDWYRSSSSTASAQFTPVFAFDIVYTDKASGLTTSGQLEWEGAYNGITTAPTNAWQSASLTDGTFWVQGGLFGQSPSDRGPINTACGNTNQGGSQLFLSIADWASSSCLANAQVYGVNVQVGSGWSGTFDGAVDNVSFAFDGGPSADYNFQTDLAPVPEPATLSMLGMGLVGLAGLSRRKRRR